MSVIADVTIGGRGESGFEAVAAAFEQNLTLGRDVGASCCVYHRGRPVVDIWAGMADSETGRVWEQDTVALTMSITMDNGFSDARSLARTFAAAIGVVDGIRLLAPETLEMATTLHSDGNDMVLGGSPFYRLALGVHLQPAIGPTLGPRAFGHYGSGGPIGWADPERELGFAFLPNQQLLRTPIPYDERLTLLHEAVYAAVRPDRN